jgi:hypothetical protein
MGSAAMKGSSSEFLSAVNAAMEDHARYGHIDSGDDWRENGAMRVVGVARADTLRLMELMHEEFADDFMRGDPDLANALLGIIEICLATGVRLERARWESLLPE